MEPHVPEHGSVKLPFMALALFVAHELGSVNLFKWCIQTGVITCRLDGGMVSQNSDARQHPNSFRMHSMIKPGNVGLIRRYISRFTRLQILNRLNLLPMKDSLHRVFENGKICGCAL